MTKKRNDGGGIFDVLVGFGGALRHEGVAVGSGQVLPFCQASARLDPTDLVDLYWSGRACLVTRQVDVAAYDRVFRAYFLGAQTDLNEFLRLKAQVSPEADSMLEILPGDDSGEERPEEEHLGLRAPPTEPRPKRFFGAGPPEGPGGARSPRPRSGRRPPRRGPRRTRPGSCHRYPDLRRTIRLGLRTQGEMVEQC